MHTAVDMRKSAVPALCGELLSMLCSCWICQVSSRAQHRAKVGTELHLSDFTAWHCTNMHARRVPAG
jgi:hypothetical protein